MHSLRFITIDTGLKPRSILGTNGKVQLKFNIMKDPKSESAVYKYIGQLIKQTHPKLIGSVRSFVKSMASESSVNYIVTARNLGANELIVYCSRPPYPYRLGREVFDIPEYVVDTFLSYDRQKALARVS